MTTVYVPTTENPSAEAGFSLVELMISLVVFMVALGGLAVQYTATVRATNENLILFQSNREIQAVAETLRGADFSSILTMYPDGVIPMADFDGTCTVDFYTDETEDTPEANEFGLPRDLDGDGVISNTDVSSEYYLLPARVELTFHSGVGATTYILNMILANEDTN